MLVYCIDLDSKCPKVLDFEGKELDDDLEFFGVNDPLDLADYDRKIFLTRNEAEKYLDLYLKVLSQLKYSTHTKHNRGNFPCMLYKSRYMCQTLLGEKMQTYRTYKKNWQPGQKFYLHNQVEFLLVELKKITEDDGEYCYEFTLT